MNGEIISIDRLDEHEKLIRENGYLRTERNKLKDRIDKATKEVKELYEIAKEQDSDNVNLIDRLELILKKLRGEDNE